MAGFSTRAIHAKQLKKDSHGSLHCPVYENVAFEFDSAEDLEKAFLGEKPSHTYSRISNPTVEHFEQKVAQASGAFAAVATASGMAAISNLIIALLSSGDNLITTKHLFGNTYSLFEKTLKPWGLKITYADLTHPESVEALVDGNTRAIFVETITNPQLEVADLKALGRLAKKNNILFIVDSTITPLCFLKPKDLGINIEVLSSTKYISGGATSVGGLIIDHGNFDWKNNPKLADDAKKYGPFTLAMKLKREVFRNLGACLSPHSAFLMSIGLESAFLRIEKSCASTLEIAKHLSRDRRVKNVNYPGLESSASHAAASKLFGNRFGAILTFDLGSKKDCFKFMNALKMVRRATNLNDNRTLIIHPASTIFCEYSPELKSEMGVGENMVRLAVGIEETEDIIEDIDQAMEAL